MLISSTSSEAAKINMPASGLPTGSTKPENLARLEKSREWMKNYRLFHRTEEPAKAPIGHQETEKDAI